MLSPYDRPGTFKRPFQPPRAAACGRPASRRCAAGHHRPWIGWPPRPDSARWRLRRRSSLAPRSSSATGPGRARQHTLASISMPNTRFRRCAGATCAAHRTTGRTRAASRAERQQRVVATLAAAQSQEAVRQDAALQKFTVIFTVKVRSTSIGAGLRAILRRLTFRDLSRTIDSWVAQEHFTGAST